MDREEIRNREKVGQYGPDVTQRACSSGTAESILKIRENAKTWSLVEDGKREIRSRHDSGTKLA